MQNLNVMLTNNRTDTKLQRIAFAEKSGYHFILVEDILYCQADGNYTVVHLRNATQKISCKSIKHFENLLVRNYHFFRIHNSTVINLNHLLKYTKADGGMVQMLDGHLFKVSRHRKKDFLEIVGGVSV